MGPPTAASGETWPMDAPLEAPENLPSVISATEDPSPIPAIADVGFSISLMPGPPLGPSYLITTTSPALIFPPRIASMASSSQSNTLAGPSCTIISGTTAERLTIPVSGAIFPLSTAIPPSAIKGSSMGLMVSGSIFTEFFIFSPTVFPVTVMQSRFKSPFFESSFITA